MSADPKYGRDFSKVQRLVIKIGTATISGGAGVDQDYLAQVAAEVKRLLDQGRQVLIVTSGAIGMGSRELGFTQKVTDLHLRQACAAIGQPQLMAAWRAAFAGVGLSVAQVLLTNDLLSVRGTYLNLRSTIETLLSLGVVPIFNENDAVSIAEIGRAFGDNDKLSALVASKMDAQLLLILSDIDALYTADPRKNPEARRISVVDAITPEIIEGAGAAGTTFSTGGMRTKIRAVLIAEKAGTTTVLAHGRAPGVIGAVLEGQDLGTVFLAKPRQPSRLRWIFNSHPLGRLTVDAGALEALRAHKSLLPKGLVKVEGEFPAGSVVLVNEVLKLVSKYSSHDLRRLAGKGKDEITALLGKADVIARPEDMAWLDKDPPT